MLYFIPAWYQDDHWCENEQYWYVRRMRTEFDDTVKQMQLFHRSRAYPYQMLLLSYTPNFRHFLHRQSVYHAPYWSCFDAIQEICRKKVMVLSFHNLNWPENVEFLYTPFAATVLLHGVKYAQIDFGEDGNPIQVEMYKDGVVHRRNIYDDRGFVSSTIIYDEGKPKYQEFLCEDGVWKMRHFVADDHVDINPERNKYLLEYKGKGKRRVFSSTSYDSLEDVILEVFASWLTLTDENDIFCAAMHSLHMDVLCEALYGRKTILSFFSDRFDIAKSESGQELLLDADYIITDSKVNSSYIKQVMGDELPPMKDITPYDSRVDFGISQQLNVQKILVPIDGLSEDVLRELIPRLAEYMEENENARVHLFTRRADYDMRAKLLAKAREYLEDAGLEPGLAEEVREDLRSENDLDDDDGERIEVKFFVEQCVDELSVSKCMREQRIVVDLRQTTDIYLRISCISTAIPQILMTSSQYMVHGKNGLQIKNLSELNGALVYYLDGLSNWNEAMVYSYELGKQFTTGRLIDDWKGVIESIG